MCGIYRYLSIVYKMLTSNSNDDKMNIESFFKYRIINKHIRC